MVNLFIVLQLIIVLFVKLNRTHFWYTRMSLKSNRTGCCSHWTTPCLKPWNDCVRHIQSRCVYRGASFIEDLSIRLWMPRIFMLKNGPRLFCQTHSIPYLPSPLYALENAWVPGSRMRAGNFGCLPEAASTRAYWNLPRFLLVYNGIVI